MVVSTSLLCRSLTSPPSLLKLVTCCHLASREEYNCSNARWALQHGGWAQTALDLTKHIFQSERCMKQGRRAC